MLTNIILNNYTTFINETKFDFKATNIYHSLEDTNVDNKAFSIIGFDDLPICPYTSPPLTTIRQDRIEIGKCAYYAASSLMNGISIGTVLLHAKLMVRGSTAPPGKGQTQSEL